MVVVGVVVGVSVPLGAVGRMCARVLARPLAHVASYWRHVSSLGASRGILADGCAVLGRPCIPVPRCRWRRRAPCIRGCGARRCRTGCRPCARCRRRRSPGGRLGKARTAHDLFPNCGPPPVRQVVARRRRAARQGRSRGLRGASPGAEAWLLPRRTSRSPPRCESQTGNHQRAENHRSDNAGQQRRVVLPGVTPRPHLRQRAGQNAGQQREYLRTPLL